MSQKLRISLLAALLALTGCGAASPEDPVTGYVTDTVTIVSVRRPKHFSVDVRDGRGAVYTGVARSKHCNGWQNTARVGARYTVPFKVHRSGARSLMSDELNSLLCP